ncbi:hypothetical protein [Methanolobus sp. WCC4]|uniref:hypothetical protein n=1 Tax=Methanolobus sp. WCC4 TaxID=3125784 RepID=UPI0030F774C8
MEKLIYIYSIVAWFILVILAIINGIIRNSFYTEVLGELRAHQVSTLIFCTLIIAFSYVFFKYSGVTGSPRDYVYVGIMWLFLTVAFEFLFGHYVAGHSWEHLLADYNILKGRVWIVVLIVTALAPSIAYRLTDHSP